MKDDRSTRRDFILKAGSAALAPCLISTSALGSSKVPPASERVTLGFIGVGGRGNALAYQFLRTVDAQCVAVCDPFLKRQRSTAQAFDEFYGSRKKSGIYKGCALYGDFRELLARDDIDAVVIATPDHWHVPMAIHAVRAGKDIYVEKPLSVAVTWNKALREEVRRCGSVFQYGTQQRSDHRFRTVCELVRNRVIGELERMEVWCPGMAAPGWYESTSKGGGSTEPIPPPPDLDYEMWIGPAPMTPYTRDRCTEWGAYHVYDNALGFIAGWGVHPLDIAQWGNGTDTTVPVSYEGTGTIPAKGLFDTISEWDVRMEYAEGVKLRFMNTRTALPVVKAYRPSSDHGTTFFGTRGWVSVDRGGIHASDPALLRTRIGPQGIHLYHSMSHYANFVESVKSRGPTASPVENAVQADIISHMSDICIRMGRKIRWDPEKEEIVGDEAASRMLHRGLRSPWYL